MSPKNGWRVEEDYGDHNHPGLRLYLTLFINQEPQHRTQVWESQQDSYEARGAMSRELIFWQAIAHYQNSGGVVDDTLEKLARIIAQGHLPSVALPEGFILLQTQRVWYTDEDGARERPEHIFVDLDTRQAGRWVEDVHFEITTMQEVLDELYRENETYDDEA